MSRVVESSRCPWFSTQHVTRRTPEHFHRARQHDSDTQQTGRYPSNRVYGRAVWSRWTARSPLTPCPRPPWASRVTDGSDVASASSARRLGLQGASLGLQNIGDTHFLSNLGSGLRHQVPNKGNFQLGSTIIFFDDQYTVGKLRVRRTKVNGCHRQPGWF